MRPRDVFGQSLVREIQTRVQRGPLLLVGPVGSGTADIACAVRERTKSGVLLEPTVGVTAEEFVGATVRQLVRGISDDGVDAYTRQSAKAQRARLALAERYGLAAAGALDIARGAATGGWTLTQAVGQGPGEAAPAPTLVAITAAHRVPEQLLWELRDLANDRRVLLLTTTRREHAHRLTGSRAPLYGNADVMDLPRLRASDWARALPPELHPADLDWLLAHTRARAASTLEALACGESGQSVRTTWQRAVEARSREVENVLNLAAGVHHYASRLLMAIADGDAPYAAIPGAPSQRVARAIGKLRDVDLIEQERPRAWQIADPILHAALLERADDAPTHDGASPLTTFPSTQPPDFGIPETRRGVLQRGSRRAGRAARPSVYDPPNYVKPA